jgi:tellurite resistance-related uncharacterized protein
MAPSPIQIWLNEGRDYYEGLELCRRYVKNKTLLDLLETGDTSFTRKKMLAALNAIDEEAILDSSRPDPIQRKLKLPEYDYYSLPENLQEKHRMKAKLYRDAGILHEQLWYLQGKELEDAAGAIVTMMRANQQLWEELDYYQQHGELPKAELKVSVPEIETLKEIEIPLVIRRIQQKLSTRRKALLTTTKDNDRKILIKEITLLEAQLAKLKLRRNEIMERDGLV